MAQKTNQVKEKTEKPVLLRTTNFSKRNKQNRNKNVYDQMFLRL